MATSAGPDNSQLAKIAKNIILNVRTKEVGYYYLKKYLILFFGVHYLVVCTYRKSLG